MKMRLMFLAVACFAQAPEVILLTNVEAQRLQGLSAQVDRLTKSLQDASDKLRVAEEEVLKAHNVERIYIWNCGLGINTTENYRCPPHPSWDFDKNHKYLVKK